MSQASMPDSIELYEGAVKYMRDIIAGVRPDQMGSATPCAEWNVQALINHNIKVSQVFRTMMTGGDKVDPFDVSGPIPPEGAVAAFEASTGALLKAIKAPGAVEKVVKAPFGEMPGGQLIMIPFADLLIHKWDLAKGTGQESSMDSSMADACHALLAPMMEGMRSGGNFGPAVTVPGSANIQDKLLGITGRTP